MGDRKVQYPPEVEEFGEWIVKVVRDLAIQNAYIRLRPEAPTEAARLWRRRLAEMPPQEAVRAIVPDVVDITIHLLLRAIDQEALRLSYRGESGRVADLCDEGRGELAGWYGDAEGWLVQHTKRPWHSGLTDHEEPSSRLPDESHP